MHLHNAAMADRAFRAVVLVWVDTWAAAAPESGAAAVRAWVVISAPALARAAVTTRVVRASAETMHIAEDIADGMEGAGTSVRASG